MRLTESERDKNVLSNYLLDLQAAVQEEMDSISFYDNFTKNIKDKKVIEMIEEIINDEKDHLVLLNALLHKELEKDSNFKNNHKEQDKLGL